LSNSDHVDGLILGDREQLIMAIQNLIENAINYSPEGTKVTVTSKVEDGIIDISVTDQGIGIPDADLDRIFERFYRVDPARSRLQVAPAWDFLSSSMLHLNMAAK
jgi:two-component system, OmpR family, sensor histidine kinase SenX3